MFVSVYAVVALERKRALHGSGYCKLYPDLLITCKSLDVYGLPVRISYIAHKWQGELALNVTNEQYCNS